MGLIGEYWKIEDIWMVFPGDEHVPVDARHGDELRKRIMGGGDAPEFEIHLRSSDLRWTATIVAPVGQQMFRELTRKLSLLDCNKDLHDFS